jgi:hypothetical protein
MPEPKLPAVVASHVTVPRELFEVFQKEWRVIPAWPPAPGYWPIDARILLEGGLLQKLVANPEFNKQFQIVIMPRTQ